MNITIGTKRAILFSCIAMLNETAVVQAETPALDPVGHAAAMIDTLNAAGGRWIAPKKSDADCAPEAPRKVAFGYNIAIDPANGKTESKETKAKLVAFDATGTVNFAFGDKAFAFEIDRVMVTPESPKEFVLGGKGRHASNGDDERDGSYILSGILDSPQQITLTILLWHTADMRRQTDFLKIGGQQLALRLNVCPKAPPAH